MCICLVFTGWWLVFLDGYTIDRSISLELFNFLDRHQHPASNVNGRYLPLADFSPDTFNVPRPAQCELARREMCWHIADCCCAIFIHRLAAISGREETITQPFYHYKH